MVGDYKFRGMTKENYTKVYVSQLKANHDKIKNCLIKLQDREGTIILVCYEKPEDFCHRHIFATVIRILEQILKNYKLIPPLFTVFLNGGQYFRINKCKIYLYIC